MLIYIFRNSRLHYTSISNRAKRKSASHRPQLSSGELTRAHLGPFNALILMEHWQSAPLVKVEYHHIKIYLTTVTISFHKTLFSWHVNLIREYEKLMTIVLVLVYSCFIPYGGCGAVIQAVQTWYVVMLFFVRCYYITSFVSSVYVEYILGN